MEADPFAALSGLDEEAGAAATVAGSPEPPTAGGAPVAEGAAAPSEPKQVGQGTAAPSASPGLAAAVPPTAAAGSAQEAPRVEVSAATITRMMGIASTADLRILEGRVDLLTSKVTGLLTKVDRVLSMFGSIPTSSDIGRLEIQVGALKSMLRELLEMTGPTGGQDRQNEDKDAAAEQGRKLREGIRSSSD